MRGVQEEREGGGKGGQCQSGQIQCGCCSPKARESERWDEANRHFQENLRLSNSLDERNKEERQQKKSPGLESQGQENGSIDVI